MSTNKPLILFHWNAQGISNTTLSTQLEATLEELNVDIALINETLLKSHHKLFLRNYKVHRNDRDGARGGGVAILVHIKIPHKLLTIYKTKVIENISIEIKLNNRPITITSAYCPKFSTSFRDDIKAITPRTSEFLLLGDLNARHSAWNCISNNTAGNTLNDLQQGAHFFVIHPDSPTYYPHQANRRTSTIDLLITNSTLNISSSVVLNDSISSDHLPVLCSINSQTHEEIFTKFFNYKAERNTFKPVRSFQCEY